MCGAFSTFAHQPYAACRSGPVSSNVRQHIFGLWCVSRKCACRRVMNSHKAAAPHRQCSHLEITQHRTRTERDCGHKKLARRSSQVRHQQSAGGGNGLAAAASTSPSSSCFSGLQMSASLTIKPSEPGPRTSNLTSCNLLVGYAALPHHCKSRCLPPTARTQPLFVSAS